MHQRHQQRSVSIGARAVGVAPTIGLVLVLVLVMVAGLIAAMASASVAGRSVAGAQARATDVCGDGSGSGLATVATSDGSDHTYHWRLPDTPAPATGRPVLIWLHGDGGSGARLAEEFWPWTDPAGALVVAPNGTGRTWNHRAGDVAGTPYDAQFLSLLIDAVVACSSVDSDRIYVVGNSRGAFMPYYLLQRASTRDRIAAVAVNAGGVYCQGDDPECVVDSPDAVRHGAGARILHLHGTNDNAVSTIPKARYQSPPANDDWKVWWPMRLWAAQNGCFTGAYGGSDNGVLRDSFVIAGNRAELFDLTGNGSTCDAYQLLLVRDGGHVIRGQEQLIWSFLTDTDPIDPTEPTDPTDPTDPVAVAPSAPPAVHHVYRRKRRTVLAYWEVPREEGTSAVSGYRYTLKRRGAGLVARGRTTEALVELGRLAVGRYALAVRAVSADGVSGRTSYSFTVPRR